MAVVMAVFLFIIGAAMGIFISIVQNEKRVLSEQQLINQISYVEEYMSKALRMATTDKDGSCLLDSQNNSYPNYIYLLVNWSSDAYSGIKFLNQSDTNSSGDPICQEIFLENGVLYEVKGNNPQVALTSLTNLKINSIKFAINGSTNQTLLGASNTDLVQPRVTILLNIFRYFFQNR